MHQVGKPIQVLCTGISFPSRTGAEEELAKVIKHSLTSIFLVHDVKVHFSVDSQTEQSSSCSVQSRTDDVPYFPTSPDSSRQDSSQG